MDLVTYHRFCLEFYATLGGLLLIWGSLSGLDLSFLCLGFGGVNLEFLKYFKSLFVSECDLGSEDCFYFKRA